MGDDTPRPMANILTAAREGQLAIELRPEDFIYIDRDCEYFKEVIQNIQTVMDGVAGQKHWGLGEDNDRLVSARTLVDRFKKKANGADDGNSVFAIMEQHYKIVEDIQEVHRIIRDRMMQADSDFAAEFTSLETTLPERPPVSLPTGPYVLPGGRTK
ncbi:hypothetical protein [Nocardia sp. NPDC049707]|uniref:hypothetical protein n=1 Tax=Nocardia sp. NPDC049707 TaxID=3154735 RepID=UPI00342718A4